VTESPKTIFAYDDYRQFLRDSYALLKARDPKFSFRFFSRIAGFKSSSVLKDVMEGKRNIGRHNIGKFAKALKLEKDEAFFFEHLVLMNQAKTLKEREHHAERLLQSQKMKELHPLADAQFNYFRRWYFVPVRELVSTVGFREDPEWIARKISPRISALDAAAALENLKKLGLVERGADGKLRQTNENVASGDEVTSTAVFSWHHEMLKKAAESLDRHEYDERDISAVSVSVSADRLPKLKEMIRTFRKAILDECSRDPSPEGVYHLGIQLFPVTDPGKDGGS
jgi:uncharacterized protein (TIGR02147 family)